MSILLLVLQGWVTFSYIYLFRGGFNVGALGLEMKVCTVCPQLFALN